MMPALSFGGRVPPEDAANGADTHVRAALADLELLARWAVRIYGRGVSAESGARTTGEHAAREDERPEEFARVMDIHRRFEKLRSGGGCLHYAVLEWCYLRRGGEERTKWVDLMGTLGWRFATPRQRKVWEDKRKSVASTAPRLYGQRLYDAAVAAFANSPRGA